MFSCHSQTSVSVPGEWEPFPKDWCLTGSNAASDFWTFWTLCSCKSHARGYLQTQQGQDPGTASTEGRQSSPLHQPVGMGTERAQTPLFLHYMTEIILSTGDSQLSSLSWHQLPKSVSLQQISAQGTWWPLTQQFSLSAPRRLIPFVDLPQRICPMSQRNSWFIIQCLFQSITLFFISWLPEIPTSPVLTGHILHLLFLSETVVPCCCAQLNTGQVHFWSWQCEFL